MRETSLAVILLITMASTPSVGQDLAHGGPPVKNLSGAYGFTGAAACLVAPGSSTSSTNPTPGVALPNSGFNPKTLQPVGDKSFSHSFAVEGIWRFNGDGTGSVKGTAVTVTVPPTPGPTGSGYPTFAPSASSEDFSYAFTYVVNPDGSWTSNMVPNSYTGTLLTGPRTGQTYTVDRIPTVDGLIGAFALTLTGAHTTTAVEIHTFSNGDVWPMICHRSRVFIRLPQPEG
jgi:hypothetical protein